MDSKSILSPVSIQSPVRKELDFQPQLWLTEKTSGALVNRVRLLPVALAQATVKYALTEDRGSRYGCGGIVGEAVAGRVPLAVVGFEYDDGSEEEIDGEADAGRGVPRRPTDGEDIV